MFDLVSLTYSTVSDYTRYCQLYPDLLGPKGDLKDVQRPWALETVQALVAKGGSLIDMGGSRCELAACLMNEYAVTVVDPYDGSGSGPTDPEPYRSRYPDLSIVTGLVGRDLDIPGQDAVVSTSVVEHIPIKRHADTVAGIGEVLKPGGYSIHAIDLTVRGVNDFLMVTGDIAESFIRAHGVECDITALRRRMLDDVETYYLSPLMYQQWRRDRSMAKYPWRQVGSLNVILRRAA